MRRLSGWLGFGVWALILLLPKSSSSQPLYYNGKTITVIEGRSPGGVGDVRTKLSCPSCKSIFLGIQQAFRNVGRTTGRQLRVSGKGGGLTIGASSPGVLSSAILGEPGVESNPYKFLYLGSPFSENNNIFANRRALGINNLESCAVPPGSESEPNRWATYSTFADACSLGF